jgi:hypothetical protein
MCGTTLGVSARSSHLPGRAAARRAATIGLDGAPSRAARSAGGEGGDAADGNGMTEIWADGHTVNTPGCEVAVEGSGLIKYRQHAGNLGHVPR